MDGPYTETTQYYEIKLKEGQDYEQWVSDRWPEVYKDRTLHLHKGRQAQLEGETAEGIEIKYDKRFAETNRIYIETHEKTNPANREYVKSGIYREDNTKIWLIGDYVIWFLFSKAKLVWLDKLDPPFLYRPQATGTSIGFCLPVKNAMRLCLDYQEFESQLF